MFIVFAPIFCILFLVGLIAGWFESDNNATKLNSNTFYEEMFITIPSNDSCYQYSAEFASKPHVAGMAQTRVLGAMFGDVLADLGMSSCDEADVRYRC